MAPASAAAATRSKDATTGSKPAFRQPSRHPVQVPVYLTYLTATATKAGVGFRKDVYGRDS